MPPRTANWPRSIDLLDPLVSGRNQILGDRPEIEFLAGADREARRAQGSIGDRLSERGGARHHDRVLLSAKRIKGIDPQPDEVGRRGDVGGVAGSPRGVEANPARRQVGTQIGGQITGGAIVGADHQGRAIGEPAIVLEQGRNQQRSKHCRDAPG